MDVGESVIDPAEMATEMSCCCSSKTPEEPSSLQQLLLNTGGGHLKSGWRMQTQRRRKMKYVRRDCSLRDDPAIPVIPPGIHVVVIEIVIATVM